MNDLEHLKIQLNAATELREWIAGEIARLESPSVEKWQPKSGVWRAHENKLEINPRDYGIERATKEQAIAAAKRMRTFNRLDAWIDENIEGHVECKVEYDRNSVAVVRYFDRDEVMKLEKLVENEIVIF